MPCRLWPVEELSIFAKKKASGRAKGEGDPFGHVLGFKEGRTLFATEMRDVDPGHGIVGQNADDRARARREEHLAQPQDG